MATEIKNKKFRTLMNDEGLGKILLIKGEEYFYITSDDEYVGNLIATLPTTSICVNSFADMKMWEWIVEIKNLLYDVLDDIYKHK